MLLAAQLAPRWVPELSFHHTAHNPDNQAVASVAAGVVAGTAHSAAVAGAAAGTEPAAGNAVVDNHLAPVAVGVVEKLGFAGTRHIPLAAAVVDRNR